MTHSVFSCHICGAAALEDIEGYGAFLLYFAILETGAMKRTGTQRDGTGVRAWSEEWSEEESGRIRTPRKNAARRRATTTCFGRTCWPDSLSPMLHSLLPDLARDIDARREVVFLDKELRRLARFTRQYEGGEPDENRCKLGVSKFKFCANAFFVTPTRRSRSHWASLRRKRPAQHSKAVPSRSWLSA